MLAQRQLRRLGAVNIEAIWHDAGQPDPRLIRSIPGGLLAGLLLASAIVAHVAVPWAVRPAPASTIAVVADLSSTPYDFAPSAMRENILERREAGLPVPNPGEFVLEQQTRQNTLELQQEKELVSTYFSEIQSRDSDIAKLNQTVQSDQANLAQLATELGLPKDRVAAAPAPAQKGVGAATPADLAALAAGPAPAAPALAPITSAKDLAGLVARYLSLPCPLPPGDPRCGEAIDHARGELARGHGLDTNKPDARPVLNIDVAQPFGPTDVALEPLEMVDGQMVHFHDGVDLAAAYDQPVMAAASGTVVFAGVAPSGALTIEIAHPGGLHTIYMHEEQLLVQPGQQVDKGQVLGLVGSTGMSTGPHVHFMVQDPSGKPIDPMPFIG
jgi:murein DD-endopeptidase MepM/ murein hydrolase activator NlpD